MSGDVCAGPSSFIFDIRDAQVWSLDRDPDRSGSAAKLAPCIFSLIPGPNYIKCRFIFQSSRVNYCVSVSVRFKQWTCCPWSHGLRLKKLLVSVAVPPAPVRVPCQKPLAPSVASVTQTMEFSLWIFFRFMFSSLLRIFVLGSHSQILLTVFIPLG